MCELLARCGLLSLLVPVLFSLVPSTSSAVELGAPFGDGMVLQRGVPVPIWGTANPGEPIKVRFRGQVANTTADSKGRWSVALKPIRAGSAASIRIVAGRKGAKRDFLVVKDVPVGEVWLGVGEANMGAPVSEFVRRDMSLASDVASAPHPMIRLYTVGPNASWQPSNTITIRDFSALMFTLGLRLHTELEVPIGLIVASQPETALARWVSPASLKDDHGFQTAVAEGRVKGRTSDLYESLVEPLVPLAIAGVLWDQGETSTGFDRMPLQAAMKGLIEGWRKAWDRDDLPFLYIQKPNGGGVAADTKNRVTIKAMKLTPPPGKQPSAFVGAIRGNWIAVSRLPHTAMVSTTDLGAGGMPPDKWAYGTRAARVARGFVYNAQLLIYGPTYTSHEIQGRTIRVQFDHIGSGLTYRNSNKLQGFALAGANRAFHWADARIQAGSVVVQSPSVPQPRFVRYGWAVQHPWANLFNEEGLPALAFSAGN